MYGYIMQIILYIISLPARYKGMEFGDGAHIGPGYDWMSVKLKGIKLGKNVLIGRSAWLETLGEGSIDVGDRTSIGRYVHLSANSKMKIGKDCLFSYRVTVIDHEHNIFDLSKSPLDDSLVKIAPITIEDECFIGANVMILKGVTLGKHCVVGANSVVTKSFPKHSVIAGNPAKLIKVIDD